MLKDYFKYGRVITRFRSGALGNEMDSIATDLSRSGYKRESIKLYLARIAHFSAYAVDSGCSKSTLIPNKVVDHYLHAKPTISTRLAALSAIGHAKRCCANRFEVEPSQIELGPDVRLLAGYLQHLRVVRGLKPKTCEGRVLAARRMLAWHKERHAKEPLSELTAMHVFTMTHDLLTNCDSDASKSSTTTHLRSFLRYLQWESLVDQDLAQFVPKTPCWRQAHLPPQLAWESVRRAIDAIEATSPAGIRDRAVLLVLATTGMRSNELRQLTLDDIHWRAGELVLRHTKGHCDRVVPLLDETSAALGEYILQARSSICDRRIFQTIVPPIRPINNSAAVSRIVLTRLQRAGIPVQRGGAHLLRHCLATRLVESRRPIKEVADLLGHQQIDTTAIYVKVAVRQLSDVPLPFPGDRS